MKILPQPFADHIKNEVTTLCACWRIIRNDEIVLGFTDHDRALMVDGTLFQALSGFEASSVETALGLSIETQDVRGALSSNLLTDEDLIAGHYDNARVEILSVNWCDPTQFLLERVGIIGEITRQDNQFTAELRSITNPLDQEKGRRFTRRCDVNIGDAHCGVNIEQAAYQAQSSVYKVENGTRITATDLGGFTDDWFSHGLLQWTSGENDGLAIEVASHRIQNGVSVLSLWKSMPFLIKEQDTFTITAGCAKTFETCKAKFSNQLNFRGFPHLPGNDFALSYAKQGEVLDGGPLIK